MPESSTAHRATHTRGYIICALPRSGSYHLCDLLTSAGVGRPTEYLNPDALRFLGLPAHVDDARARARQALELGTSANGVYGLKVLAYHFDHYAYRGWLDDFPNRTYVYLTREDLLGQALSLARAQQTQQWTSAMPAARGERGAYDATRIRNCVNDLVLDEARWRSFFARNGIEPLHATYEELQADPQRLVSRIARAVDLPGDPQIDPAKMTLEIQRDDATDAWREAFLRDHADPGYLDSNRLPVAVTAPRTSADSVPGAPAQVVVWGAGEAARTQIEQRFDVSSIAFVVDSDARKHGDTFLGRPVRPPEALLDEHGCLVLISSSANAAAIRRTIDERFAANVQGVITLDALLNPSAPR